MDKTNFPLDRFNLPEHPMNPEIKAKWLEALRSGKYSQIDEDLNKNGGMCCLGVLCDITHPEEWRPHYLRENQMEFRGATTLPPSDLCKEVGLPDASYDHKGNMLITRYLAEMNDTGLSFLQIADFIEENL